MEFRSQSSTWMERKDATLIYPIIYWPFYSLSRLEYRCIWLRMIMRIELIGFETLYLFYMECPVSLFSLLFFQDYD
ncbi:hypothetical protein DFP95_11841 [Cohnella lupini]|uniref:Uncharacterized protein n=1 Tax=Cohnella lupini TaxID=1294267 RepID=A0A3D9I2C5_9BACL|nr:hypothetical protein DFP95_11841 [Cohnella lupini]